MNELLKTLNEYLTAAKGLVVSYGPGVWEATLSLVRFNCIFNLIVGGLCAVITAYCVKTFFKHNKLISECEYKEKDSHGIPMVISCTVACFTIIGALILLLSTYNWLGAFKPELAVLYAVAVKAGII